MKNFLWAFSLTFIICAILFIIMILLNYYRNKKKKPKEKNFYCAGCGKIKADCNLQEVDSTKEPFLEISSYIEYWGKESTYKFLYNGDASGDKLHFCKDTFSECLKAYIFNKKLIAGKK